MKANELHLIKQSKEVLKDVFANELRTGNYILDNDGTLSVVTCDWFSARSMDMTSTREATRIPLTKQWLLDFGFVWFNKKFKNRDGLFLISEANGIGLSYNKIDNDFECWLLNCDYKPKFMPCWIKHVHQLQNLYFALTGEELVKN